MSSHALQPLWDIIWIDTVEGLAQIAEAAHGEEYLPIDTETVGWQSGNEQLALLQIGIPGRKLVFLVDCLAVQSFDPIRDILVAVAPAKVAHNASFEDRQLGSRGIKMKGLRDTLPMARTLRPDLPNHQLKTVAFHVVGKAISKEAQTSDWSLRPLSREQLQYAALDVEILAEVYESLLTLEQKLLIATDATVEDIMKELAEVTDERFSLLKDIAPTLAFIEQRTEKLKAALKERLEHGAPPYDGLYGEASIKAITQTEVNTEKVKEAFPEIAPLVVAEKVERKRLLDVMKEYGIDKKRLDEVLDPKDTYYRLMLEIAMLEER
jgi:hypothetical protein